MAIIPSERYITTLRVPLTPSAAISVCTRHGCAQCYCRIFDVAWCTGVDARCEASRTCPDSFACIPLLEPVGTDSYDVYDERFEPILGYGTSRCIRGMMKIYTDRHGAKLWAETYLELPPSGFSKKKRTENHRRARSI